MVFSHLHEQERGRSEERAATQIPYAMKNRKIHYSWGQSHVHFVVVRRQVRIILEQPWWQPAQEKPEVLHSPFKDASDKDQ